MKGIVKFFLGYALFSLLLTFILSTQAGAQPVSTLPAAFQADYSVAKGSMTLGKLHASLKYSGNNYSYHKYTKATGLAALLTGIKITESTNGRFSGQNITPANYLFNQSKRSKSKIDKVNFSGNNAKGSYKNKPFSTTINGGTHDRASLELALARDIGLNKNNLSYPVVERGKKTQYRFQKLGNEKIQTPAGLFNTVKVKVIRTTNKRDTVFWLAKETSYMPVKIRHREKDDVITTVIKSYKKL